MLRRTAVDGNAYVGVFCCASDSRAFVPAGSSEAFRTELETVLGVPAVPLTIGGSSVIGALVAANDRGVVVPDFITAEEESALSAHLPITILEDRLNAAGNNVLVNDRAALVNPALHPSTVRRIEEGLGVEARKGTIAGCATVGSAAVVTSRGLVCHPKVTESELRVLEDLFGLEVFRSTANYGVPYIGSCVVANSRGALVGWTSTGLEMGRIEEGLDLIDSDQV